MHPSIPPPFIPSQHSHLPICFTHLCPSICLPTTYPSINSSIDLFIHFSSLPLLPSLLSSFSPFIYLPIQISTYYIPTYTLIHPYIHPFTHPSIHLTSNILSIHLSIYPSTYPPIYLPSIHLFTHPSVHLPSNIPSIHPSILLPISHTSTHQLILSTYHILINSPIVVHQPVYPHPSTSYPPTPDPSIHSPNSCPGILPLDHPSIDPPIYPHVYHSSSSHLSLAFFHIFYCMF